MHIVGARRGVFAPGAERPGFASDRKRTLATKYGHIQSELERRLLLTLPGNAPKMSRMSRRLVGQ